MNDNHVLTLACSDRPGLIHAVTGGLLDVDGNIGENHQFTELETSTFCMRTVVATTIDDPDEVRPCWTGSRRSASTTRPSGSGSVSNPTDLGLPLVVSNHPDCAPIAAREGIAFEHLPTIPSWPASRGPSPPPGPRRGVNRVLPVGDKTVVFS